MVAQFSHTGTIARESGEVGEDHPVGLHIRLLHLQHLFLHLRSQQQNDAVGSGIRDVSSAGLEHYLDKVGVTGSNPVHPTDV